jgi:cell filamentation protein
MSDQYRYIDPDSIYFDPETGVLRNLQNITDAEVLRFVESSSVTKRLQELYENPISIRGIDSLFQIHKYLFQDIYHWAGRKRIVEISKAGKQFFPVSYFDTAFSYIDSLIREFKLIPKDNTKRLSELLAAILDHINYLHPFREGNGRTQREFIRALASEKGFHLNLNPPDNRSVYERYMQGTIQGDIAILTELIQHLIEVE